MKNILLTFLFLSLGVFAGTSVAPDKDANGKIIQTNDAFASKSNYYFRGSGSSCVVAASTVTNCEFVISYTHVKFNGIQIINGAIGDKCDLKVLDTATGTYSTIPNFELNKFGYGWYITDNTSVKLPYVADLYIGMRVVVSFTNSTPASKTIYFNYYIHEL